MTFFQGHTNLLPPKERFFGDARHGLLHARVQEAPIISNDGDRGAESWDC
jgi:hypothetical protein